MIGAFSIARLPRIEFGSGAFSKTAGIAARYGSRVLLVTGAGSFRDSPHRERLEKDLSDRGISWRYVTFSGEPSPDTIDAAVADAVKDIDVVIGIGGGSALDAAKAIAGLLKVGASVMDYLEGVGPERQYEGPATPFVAVPTTAGTGSEATRNAVLSRLGAHGFKKSFRHDHLVAEYAVVDPDLLETCPKNIIAANGMDALTQLIESYVSLRANVMTDALAISGLRAARDGLLPWYLGEGDPAQNRACMAWAALASGITLAQTGLGSVHGLASPLGAFHPIPHGVVCGTLVAAATQVNIRAMNDREPGNIALARYARVAEVLLERRIRDPESARTALVERLDEWTRRLDLPPLSHYGIDEQALDSIVAHSRGSSMKTNPVVLSDAEVREVLERRL
ncbi:MAG: iron-containing alcohol dehydrogenase [Pseudomonadota bacterium]|nr:iron-containing alcohol dehydrogenase [Pseudomonadota bacterium]